jgi:integrase
MARRGKGEGSIFRRKDGRWTAFVTLGYGPDGRQRKKWVYGPTRRAVAEKLAGLMTSSGSRIVQAPERVTVAEWLTRYAELRGQDKKPRTRENYRHYLKKILPVLGHVQLGKLTTLQVREFYGELGALSPSVRQHLHDFFSSAMKDAVKLELARENPLTLVDRPRGGALSEPEVWTSEEARRFLGAAEGHRLYPAFYLLLALGLRIGELLALRWTDWEGERLYIRRTMSTSGRPEFGTPKTERSKRMLYLPAGVRGVLEQRRRDQRAERDLAKRWLETELIFASTVGTPTQYSNFRRAFNELIERARVPRIRIHDNRHTWVTLLRDAGVDAEVVAERAGHDVSMTMGLYSKVTDERKRKAALELEDLLKR